MVQELKISLPIYKIAYAAFFTVILSIVRGVTFTYEIGMALEAPMAMLAAVFFADTYTQEIVSKRWQLQRLYPMKKRVCSIARRMLIQQLFLWALAMIGYGLFFVFQSPISFDMAQNSLGEELKQFLVYSGAVFITLAFWGMLSNTIACIWRHMWFGIGGCLILWLAANSSMGVRLKGWNLFSYSFRNVENSGDFTWMWGKMICICACVILATTLPGLLKERG